LKNLKILLAAILCKILIEPDEKVIYRKSDDRDFGIFTHH